MSSEQQKPVSTNLKSLSQRQNTFTGSSTIASSNASEVHSPMLPRALRSPVPIGVSANATLPRQTTAVPGKVSTQQSQADLRSRNGTLSNERGPGSMYQLHQPGSMAASRRGSGSQNPGGTGETTPEELLMKLRLSLKAKQGSGVSTFSSSNTLVGAKGIVSSPFLQEPSSPSSITTPSVTVASRHDIQAVARSRSHTLSSQANTNYYSNSTFAKASYGNPGPMTIAERDPESPRASSSSRGGHSTRRGSNASVSNSNPISPTGKTLGFDFSRFHTNGPSGSSSNLTSPTSIRGGLSSLDTSNSSGSSGKRLSTSTGGVRSPFEPVAPQISLPMGVPFSQSQHTLDTHQKRQDIISPTGTIVASTGHRDARSAAASPFQKSASLSQSSMTLDKNISVKSAFSQKQQSSSNDLLSSASKSSVKGGNSARGNVPQTASIEAHQRLQSQLSLNIDEATFDEQLRRDYPTMVRCFPFKSDGLVRLTPGWDIEVFPETRYNNLRRYMFEVFNQQTNYPLIIPPDLQALIREDITQD